MKTLRATIITSALVFLPIAGLTGDARAGGGSAEVSVKMQFATSLEERRPVDPGEAFQPGKLYCWNEVRGGTGSFRLVHVWIRDGRVVWRRSVRVRGRKWVTWSYHHVTPGSWSVQVQDTEGRVIGRGSFSVTAASLTAGPLTRPTVM
jgi:hypothetical protein